MDARGWQIRTVLMLSALVALLGWGALYSPPLRNTLLLSLSAAGLSLPLGTLLAFLLLRTDVPGRKLWLGLLVLMLFLPLYLQMSAWDAAFGRQGWYLELVGRRPARPWLLGWPGAILVHAAYAIPWVTLIVGLGLRHIDAEEEEQLLLDGSIPSVFWHVTLPRIFPAVVAAVLMVLVLTAGEMTVTNVYSVRTLTEGIYLMLSQGEPLEAAHRAALPTLAALVLILALGVESAAWLVPEPRSGQLRSGLRFRLGRVRWGWLAFVVILLLGLVGLPLGSLVYKAGLVSPTTTRDAGYSLGKFVHILVTSPYEFRYDLAWTVLVSGCTASLAVVIAIPLAWFWRARAQGRVVLALSAVGLAIPGPLVGLSIVWLFNEWDLSVLRWAYHQSVLPTVLALLVRALPPALLMSWHALRSIPQEQWELALLDGAGPLTRLLRVGVAQRRWIFGAAWMASLTIAAGDLSASILVTPPGVDLVSRRIFGLVHSGVDDQLAGLSLTAAWLFALLAFATWKMLARERRELEL